MHCLQSKVPKREFSVFECETSNTPQVVPLLCKALYGAVRNGFACQVTPIRGDAAHCTAIQGLPKGEIGTSNRKVRGIPTNACRSLAHRGDAGSCNLVRDNPRFPKGKIDLTNRKVRQITNTIMYRFDMHDIVRHGILARRAASQRDPMLGEARHSIAPRCNAFQGPLWGNSSVGSNRFTEHCHCCALFSAACCAMPVLCSPPQGSRKGRSSPRVAELERKLVGGPRARA